MNIDHCLISCWSLWVIVTWYLTEWISSGKFKVIFTMAKSSDRNLAGKLIKIKWMEKFDKLCDYKHSLLPWAASFPAKRAKLKNKTTDNFQKQKVFTAKNYNT